MVAAFMAMDVITLVGRATSFGILFQRYCLAAYLYFSFLRQRFGKGNRNYLLFLFFGWGLMFCL